jgi:hypothetical protein
MNSPHLAGVHLLKMADNSQTNQYGEIYLAFIDNVAPDRCSHFLIIGLITSEAHSHADISNCILSAKEVTFESTDFITEELSTSTARAKQWDMVEKVDGLEIV